MHGAFLSVSDFAATNHQGCLGVHGEMEDGWVLGGQGEDHDTAPGLFRFEMCGSMVWVGGLAVVLGQVEGAWKGWGGLRPGLGEVRLG